jgi:hypothetical protein
MRPLRRAEGVVAMNDAARVGVGVVAVRRVARHMVIGRTPALGKGCGDQRGWPGLAGRRGLRHHHDVRLAWRGRAGFAFRHIPAERRDLDGLVAELDVCQPEPPADDPAVPEQLLDLPGMGIRADVEVLRPAPEHQVTDAAPDKVSLVIVLLQAMEDAQGVRINVPARDRVSLARNDKRFGHGS